MRALTAEGVDTRAVCRRDAATTLSLIGLDERGVPSYAFYGQGCADRLLGPADLAHVPQALQALNFGSYATVVEPIASTLRALVERERGRAGSGRRGACGGERRASVRTVGHQRGRVGR